MAAWLIAALKMLAGGALLGVGTELGMGLIPGDPMALDVAIGGGSRGQTAMASPGAPSGYHYHMVNGVWKMSKIRRRRRRTLTASDRADIAFIAGVLGKPAAREVAAIIAAR